MMLWHEALALCLFLNNFALYFELLAVCCR